MTTDKSVPAFTPQLDHVAYSFCHGGFNPYGEGGCSCKICCYLRVKVVEIREKEEAGGIGK